MKGAIVGDFVGSLVEGYQLIELDYDLDLFNLDLSKFEWILKKTSKKFRNHQEITDDTICAMGLLKAILQNQDPATCLRDFCIRHANVDTGFGKAFSAWLKSESLMPYASNANGALMRLSFIPFLKGISWDDLLKISLDMTDITHNTDTARQAVSELVSHYKACAKLSSSSEKLEYFKEIVKKHNTLSMPQYHALKTFEMNSLNTLRQAERALADSNDFNSVLINCMYIGGDIDTLCCIAGGLAEQVYSVPDYLQDHVLTTLPKEMTDLLEQLLTR